jgi:hypothetical protein
MGEYDSESETGSIVSDKRFERETLKAASEVESTIPTVPERAYWYPSFSGMPFMRRGKEND